MQSQTITEYIARGAENHRESAARALRETIANLQEALDRIESDTPSVRSTIGGQVLDHQRFDDAERFLVRYWDAANYAAILGRETRTMNRLQEAAVERLALRFGRVALKEGFADGNVRATVPTAAEFHITEDGAPVQQRGMNMSVRWPEGARYEAQLS